MTEWKFHGRTVHAHPALQKMFEEKWVPLMQPYWEEVFETEILLRIKEEENDLANLLTSLLQTGTGADFSFLSLGQFRGAWYPGKVTEGSLFKMLPFADTIQTFKIKGKEIKAMMAYLQENSYVFFAGLRQTLKKKPVFWEVLKTTWTDGSEIDDESEYTGATINFYLDGGDQMKAVMEQKIYIPRVIKDYGGYREFFRRELKALKKVRKGEFFNPSKPRMVVVDA